MQIGIVSGYFNPLHQGHLEYIHAAKELCDHLIAIINNDKQVQLKGSKPFMDERHRAVIVDALRDVDEVVISIDTDKKVCETLIQIHRRYTKLERQDKFYFFNSGDRTINLESKELQLCHKLGIKYVAIPLPKVYSSSTLLAALS